MQDDVEVEALIVVAGEERIKDQVAWLEIGRNSVTPCMKASSVAARQSTGLA